MFRFPACRSAAAISSCLTTTNTNTTTTAHHHHHHQLRSSSSGQYSKTRVVTESRLSTWCRQLWGLANKSGSGTGRGVTPAQAADTLRRVATAIDGGDSNDRTAAANGGGRSTSANGNGSGADLWARGGWDLSTITPEQLISALRAVIAAGTHHLPTVLVEPIWEVYDAILPPEVQADLDHALNAERLNSFFSFVSLITEMDFDIAEVKKAAARLDGAVALYEALRKEAHAVNEASTAAASSERASTAATQAALLEAQAALSERMNNARAKVISACFKTRNAGSPLYHTWLRHTASTEGGVRRMMDFRKTVHFFDIACKKRIRTLKNQVAAAASNAGGGGETTTTPEDRTRELLFWQKREREISVLDASLAFLFHDFFSKEYLVMEELTWLSTPPAMLEQIMAAESVQPFTRGLAEMKDRLQPTHHRHIFAFLHPAVVEEPLIGVQVALTKGISGSVDYILGRATPLSDPENTGAHGVAFKQHLVKYGPDTSDKERVDTAIFYSINSTQSALRGMDMGNQLIKRVVREIEENINTSRTARGLLPIVNFSTLSPIQGYARWLAGEAERLAAYAAKPSTSTTATPSSSSQQQQQRERALVPSAVSRAFGHCASAEELEVRYYGPVRAAVVDYASRHELGEDDALGIARLKAAMGNSSNTNDNDKQYVDLVAANSEALSFLIRQFLAPDVNDPWWMDHAFTCAIEQPLLRSIAHYLCREKKKKNAHILDPVGNFHVHNGATIFRINFLGNACAQGSHESGCAMVNYWYNTSTIAENVAAYERDKTVAVDTFLTDLLRNECDA